MPNAAFALLLTLLSLAAAAQPASSLAPRVRVETTEGDFVVELDAVRAPLTAENFLRYVRDGAYDGTVFHRVIPNFVVQGGGFDEKLAARAPRAPVPNESGNGLSNRRGTVGLAREDSPKPRVLLVGQPTRGVDIGAIEFIHGRLRAMRDAGGAVLVVSSELDEILALADRVLVMARGRISGELPIDACTEGALGRLMGGAGQADPQPSAAVA